MPYAPLKSQGAIFLALFFSLYLCSCGRPCLKWQECRIRANCPNETFIRTTYPAENAFDGIEVEWISSNDTVRLYLNIFTFEFPRFEGDPRYSEVILCINDQEYSFMADRFDGGQKLLLPLEAMELINQTLSNGDEVVIRAGRHHSCIP